MGVSEDGAAKGADRDVVVHHGNHRRPVASGRASGANDVVSRPITATAERQKGERGWRGEE